MKRFDVSLAEGYTNNSQRIRRMSEPWVEENMFCPKCGGPLQNYTDNKPVADFFCTPCNFDFELKSKKGKIPNKLPGGAYSKMIERISSSDNPHFFFLSYVGLDVTNFFMIPKQFFTSNIVEERKPLASTARRAGWIGCNILIRDITEENRVFYVKDGVELSKDSVLQQFERIQLTL